LSFDGSTIGRMPLEPPSSRGWPPDKVVEAINRLTDQQTASARRQHRVNVALLLFSAVAVVLAIVSLLR